VSAPDILDEIKDDLGVTDSNSDAWFTRRIAGIWARMEAYTSRLLCAPPQQFIDDWGNISNTQKHHPMPPVLHYWPRGSVFLRYFPVVSLDEIVVTSGTTVDPTLARFDAKSGKLFALDGEWSHDLGHILRSGQAKITYTAGWADVPADLYEVVLGALQPLWAAKQGGGVPGVSGAVTGITVQDVGAITLAEENLFVSSAAKSGHGAGDPLLGPYANMLDLYIDHRARIGNEGQPTTTAVAPAAAEAKAEP
jgi:hypothetical protein